MNIIAFSGSLRKKSYNTGLLRALQKLAPADSSIEILDISRLPLFNQDDEESNFPFVGIELKNKIRSADGVLIATPEFNRTPPGPLKNFLDWSARPEGDNPWIGKPVGILGASTGARGASFAQYDMRRILAYFDAYVMNQPEVYVGNAENKFDTEGNLTDEKTREQLQKFLTRFIAHVERAPKA